VRAADPYFSYEGGKPGAGGTGTLSINGRQSVPAGSNGPFRSSTEPKPPTWGSTSTPRWARTTRRATRLQRDNQEGDCRREARRGHERDRSEGGRERSRSGL